VSLDERAVGLCESRAVDAAAGESLVEDWHLVLVVSRGERRNLCEQSITQRTGDLRTVLDVGAIKYAGKFLGHMSSNDDGTLCVSDLGKLLSTSVE